jgi:hypothetical protein
MDRSMCKGWGNPVSGLYKSSEQNTSLYHSICVVVLGVLKSAGVYTRASKQFSSTKNSCSYLKNTDLYSSSPSPTTATIYLNTYC